MDSHIVFNEDFRITFKLIILFRLIGAFVSSFRLRTNRGSESLVQGQPRHPSPRDIISQLVT